MAGPQPATVGAKRFAARARARAASASRSFGGEAVTSPARSRRDAAATSSTARSKAGWFAFEGLDLPEVTLVAILDADKEGFLRGERALIQTIGRAARNVNGRVIMYADKETEAMRRAIDETNRRRAIQRAYNEEHGITPETIVKGISDISEFLMGEGKVPKRRGRRREKKVDMTPSEIESTIVELEEEMLAAAEELRFEYAAKLRDEIRDLRRELDAALAE